MHKKIALVLLTLIAPPGYAQSSDWYYLNLAFVANQRGIDVPPVYPSHQASYAADYHNDRDGWSFNVGRVWKSGWYADVGFADLGVVGATAYRSSSTDSTTVQDEKDAQSVRMMAGRLIAIADALALYVGAGLHSYSETTTTITTEVVSPTVAVSVASTTDTGVDAVYSAGIVALEPHSSIKLGASDYRGVDRITMDLSVELRF